MRYGDNGTLTAAEFERGKEAAIAKIKAARAEALAEADRHRALADQLEAERAAASTVEDDERLEKAIDVHQRAEAVARRNAERRGEELEAAQADLVDARGKIASDAVAKARAATAEERARYVASPNATNYLRFRAALDREDAAAAVWRQAVGELAGTSVSDLLAARAAAAEAHARLVASPTSANAEEYRRALTRVPRGDSDAYPPGVVDDPDDSADLPDRIALLSLPPRQPSKARSAAAAGSDAARQRARDARIRRCVFNSTTGLSDAKALADPEEREEAVRAWHARHDEPRARQLERLGSARTER